MAMGAGCGSATHVRCIHYRCPSVSRLIQARPPSGWSHAGAPVYKATSVVLNVSEHCSCSIHNSGARTHNSQDEHDCPAGGTVCQAKRGDVLIIADDISKTHDGEKQLFEGLTFSVVAGDHLAIVGPNGSGKSTLLKLIAGKESHDTGALTRNKGVTIGYLPQDPNLTEGATVLQAVLASDSVVAKAVQQYQDALKASELKGGVITKELEAAIEKMNTYNAWEVDAEAKRVLEAVGIMESMLNTPVSALSGGQRKRVALAASLLGQPDLLVLDEPTNHMDVEMISWMEKELKKEDLAVVLVSHDRFFMENCCDRILELDKGRAVMHNFGGPGSYDLFKQARAARRAAQAAAAADARTLFRREAEWVVKQPKARQAKSQARVQRFYELSERIKDVPQADLKVDFGPTSMVRQGNKVIKMANVGFSVGGKEIIKQFTYDFMPGERLGIVGRNGAGKSTLLNLIAGSLAPTSGSRDVGETAVVGYFQQYPPPVHEDLRVIDYIREIADDQKARKAGIDVNPDPPEVLLEKLGFTPRPRQFQRVSALSGGERRRLHLAATLVSRPNLLILDEPTNHLDLSTVEVVEDLVKQYKGVLLVVSHDRAFMDNVADRLLVLRGDGLVRLFQGSYSEYLEILAEEDAEAAALAALEAEEKAAAAAAAGQNSSQAAASNNGLNGTGKGPAKSSVSSTDSGSSSKDSAASKGSSSAATAVAAPPKKARKLGYYEEQEYKKLCAQMDQLNRQRDELDKKVMALAQSGADLAELERSAAAMAAVSEQIDNMSERWLELAELAGDL